MGHAIANRLGWLDLPASMPSELPGLQQLADAVRKEGVSHVYLLGMGGSSLCAEVIRSVYVARDGFPHLVVMDTTDEAAITAVLRSLEPRRTLFLVASKSGTTVEPASMEKLYWAHMTEALGSQAGRHFIAITDPGRTGGARSVARLPASVPQSAGHRRAFFGAVALRSRARRARRRTGR